MGNRSILSSADVSFGALSTVTTIDANSRPEGAYSVPRTINQQQVYLAPDDAARLDAELANRDGARQYTVATQGHTWERVQDLFRDLVQW